MKPLYYATIVLTALALTAGEAEAKRRKRVDVPAPVPAVAALIPDEINHLLVSIYHSRYNQIEADGKRAQRDYTDRLKHCTGELVALDFCSKVRVSELERAAAAPQRDLDEWTLDYSIVSGLSPEKRGELEPLLRRYKTDCADRRGKTKTAYCQELGVGIFDEGAKLSAPAPTDQNSS